MSEDKDTDWIGFTPTESNKKKNKDLHSQFWRKANEDTCNKFITSVLRGDELAEKEAINNFKGHNNKKNNGDRDLA